MRTRGNVFGSKKELLNKYNKYNTKYSYLLPKHIPQWLPFYYWYCLNELNINSAKNNMLVNIILLKKHIRRRT